MIDSNYLERLIYISDKISQGFLRWTNAKQ
jgi:hypothetical protein